jgi:hypothetical protein
VSGLVVAAQEFLFFSSSSGHGLSTVVNLVFHELDFLRAFSFCSRVVQA